jgi:hypothetical protein
MKWSSRTTRWLRHGRNYIFAQEEALMRSSTQVREIAHWTPAPSISSATLSYDHVDHLLTDVGLWQHTHLKDPNPRHGYSIDDEARGLIVGLRYWDQDITPGFYGRLANTCFQFIQRAAITPGPMSGHYHNFCDANGHWLDPIGSDDSFGRTFWGLGVAHAVNAPFAPRAEAERLLCGSLPAIDELAPHYLRAASFVILGLVESRVDDLRLRLLADQLSDAYENTAGPDWHWFEDYMTYENPRLPQALLAAFTALPEVGRYRQIGAEALDFLLKVSRSYDGAYAPVGNAPLEREAWFKRGDRRPPQFDQQPVDAGALVEACVQAYRVTRKSHFRTAAWDALDWYHGKNIHKLPVYNPETGSVADALTPSGLNRNQGAESVLSVHLAYQALHSL